MVDNTETIKEIEYLFNSLLFNLQVHIFFKDRNSCFIKTNHAHAKFMGFSDPEEVIGKTDFDIFPKEDAERFYQEEQDLMERGESVRNRTWEVTSGAGPVRWLLEDKVPLKDSEGQVIGLVGIGRDVTDLVEAQQSLKESNTKLEQSNQSLQEEITERERVQNMLVAAQKELIESARKAGMFDIASNTLHNVGNLLNSVATSAQIIKDITQKSQITDFAKANQLLQKNMDNIETFVLSDPKSKLLFSYYMEIEKALIGEVDRIKHQINRLTEKIDSINYIVKSQQEYADFGSVSDEYNLADIVFDVLAMQENELEQNNISVVTEITDVHSARVQKVKVVQILVNLIKNARDSMLEKPPNERTLTISLEEDNESVYVRITDTGIGIKSEDLKKIFAYGVTSKPDRQGYGLHSSANFMTEMGGRIWAESNGPNQGSTFVLQFKRSS